MSPERVETLRTYCTAAERALTNGDLKLAIIRLLIITDLFIKEAEASVPR